MNKKFISILIVFTFFIKTTEVNSLPSEDYTEKDILRPMAVAVSTQKPANKVDLTEIPDRQLLEKTAKIITRKLKRKYLGMVRSDDIYNCAFPSVWVAWKEYDPENEKGLSLAQVPQFQNELCLFSSSYGV